MNENFLPVMDRPIEVRCDPSYDDSLLLKTVLWLEQGKMLQKEWEHDWDYIIKVLQEGGIEQGEGRKEEIQLRLIRAFDSLKLKEGVYETREPTDTTEKKPWNRADSV